VVTGDRVVADVGREPTPLIVKQSGQVTVTSTVPAYVWRCEVCGWLGTGWTSESGATREAVDHLWNDHQIAACDPDELGPHGFNGHVQHLWQHVKGTDSTDQCVRCGRFCGK